MLHVFQGVDTEGDQTAAEETTVNGGVYIIITTIISMGSCKKDVTSLG